MTRLLTLALVPAFLGVLLLSGGCANKLTAKDVRKHPSPELYTLTRSRQQNKNERRRLNDVYWRAMAGDAQRALLQDRPTHLHPHVLP